MSTTKPESTWKHIQDWGSNILSSIFLSFGQFKSLDVGEHIGFFQSIEMKVEI